MKNLPPALFNRDLAIAQANADAAAVDLLAAAMKKKLAYKRSARGGSYSGWKGMSEDYLWMQLAIHIIKRDPVDIGNFAAFIHAKRFRAKGAVRRRPRQARALAAQ